MELFFPPHFCPALAHFVALLSPGPDFPAGGLRARYRCAAAPDCASASPQATGCIFSGDYRLERAAPVYVAVYAYRALRALYLLWIGSQVRSTPQPLSLTETNPHIPTWRKQILLGLGSAC
jgi:hypothetical protein